jgi:SAM-dependent methyltransferase
VDQLDTSRRLRFRYIFTICTGSFLLFLVQPMVARMALPRLGGAPSVWNSAMLVYQALLLGGYAYAHWLGRFTPRRQAAIHIALFAAAAFMLPIGLMAGTPSATANPFLWVPWLFVTSIGPLFFAVSAQAPLMQRWFSVSGGGDPYPLYAASNVGSFLGLITYPLIVEPLLPLWGQSWLWTGGYALVALLVIACAVALAKQTAEQRVLKTGSASWREISVWMLLAAIPSGLMLSTSTHLTTDIIAMPLLWVLPLGLYLLSFSVAFAAKRGLSNAIISVTPILLIIGGGTAFANSAKFPMVYAPLGLVLLFAVSVALHAKLYDRRPDPSRLTSFYLAMSAGGALGGVFCALIAPVIFDWAYEHPVLILASALTLTAKPLLRMSARLWHGDRQWVPALTIVGLSAASFAVTRAYDLPNILSTAALAIIALAVVAIGNRITFAACLALLMLTLGGFTAVKDSLTTDNRVRSFFGVYTVGTQAGPRRYLVHGTTIHGLQSLVPGQERDPLTYYAPKSGVGLALANLPKLYGPHARVGIVGLGSGTVSCYAQAGHDWRFYEIDPAIAAIARDTNKFTYLSRCLPNVPIEIGDARIVLAGEPAAGLDVLVVDAFSSDAVPMHLLTKEALQVYRRRLAPGGLLLIHISNRFMNLEPVLAAAAASADGWHSALRDYHVDAAEAKRGYATSAWVALASDNAALDHLKSVTRGNNWRDLRGRAGFAGWTDDHASILPLLKVLEKQ